MKILLTGATGYIGKRLLPVLVKAGHEVICCVRDKHRFSPSISTDKLSIYEVDFSQAVDLNQAPKDFEVVYYLIHSMGVSIGDFADLEAQVARNFTHYLDQTQAKQVIYLTGIANDEDDMSEHLASRLKVEHILAKGKVPLTALRAGIIVGSGSASFEIIRDLVEKLPVMIAPRWLNSKCQPLAIRNVIQYLTEVLLREDCFNQNFDIGCREVLTYRQMLLGYAHVRGLWRLILTVPIMTPRLSSYWLYFVTSTSYPLAVNLVNSMKHDVIVRNNDLADKLGIQLYSYEEAVRMAFMRIEQNMVISSWKDALVTSYEGSDLNDYIRVPVNGCFVDKKERQFNSQIKDKVLENIWSIGGERGWYYGNWLWKIRGYLDKLVGGVGLRRGRTNPNTIHAGDALDFWRVLVADHKKGRLLLYAEMKLPGEAWLEFKMSEENGQTRLDQTATFRPDGVMGRLYWYAVLPFHYFIFNGMINRLRDFRSKS